MLGVALCVDVSLGLACDVASSFSKSSIISLKSSGFLLGFILSNFESKEGSSRSYDNFILAGVEDVVRGSF